MTQQTLKKATNFSHHETHHWCRKGQHWLLKELAEQVNGAVR